ncbi:hypothetical protein EI94DRAFT_1755225 [Lactarius quietus]|nr:hypothetical protein EI94DRAFT_1755225 [Lactarius quietus]
MAVITTALVFLKEASSLASRVPCISPIAGMLLYAIEVHNDIRMYKGEWAVVARKLVDVASLVISVGNACERLGDEDLAHLQADLEHLKNNLEGMGEVLKKCADTPAIKRVLLRDDVLLKVKRCVCMLSFALKLFQTKVVLRTHNGQLTQDSAESKRPKASEPQLFSGREAELAQILEMVFGPRPARIAILGPGGYGKTTLACAVLTHPSVRQRFGDARYFVACESATTSGDLLIELAKALGLLEPEAGSDASWPSIRASLTEEKECIICLDNFESPWDQAAETRNSVEELLSKITSLQRVTVLVTMRGTERPARTRWTQPTLAPLKTLDSRSAQVAWNRISNNCDDIAENRIAAVNFVPPAVTSNVLAHLAQATSPVSLWKEWKEKYTRLVQRGHSHKQSSLEYSIQLSLNSKRMKDNPSARELLGVLSVLPDGIHMELLDKFKAVLNMDILSGLRVLQQCSLIEVTAERYQCHCIIRHFCRSQGLLSPKHEELMNGRYITLATRNRYQAGSYDYAEMVIEAQNTRATLCRLLKSDYYDQDMLVSAVLTFVKFSMNIGDYSDQLLDEAGKFIQQNDLPISLHIGCLQCWGRLHYYTYDLENAKLKLQEAKSLCTSHDNILHAKILRYLGDIYLDQEATSDAEAAFQEALMLCGAANDALGQGNCYSKLGGIYIKLKRLQDAGAAYSRALEIHEALGDNVGQGSDYRGLGDMQLLLKKFKHAEASYEKALEFDKAAHSMRGQAKDYEALGNTHLKNKELDKAVASFERSLELYEALNSSSGQGNIIHDLAKIYLKRSQLNEAKTAIQMALDMHKQAQDKAGEIKDQSLLNKILSGDEIIISDNE